MPRKRRKISLRWQALTSTISTTFVLILMGLVIICALTAHRLGESVRQSLTVTVMMSDDATEPQTLDYKKKLEMRQWVKDINYISREQALKEQTEAMGQDPTEFLGENPFLPLLEVHLMADYACTDSLMWITKQLKANPLVSKVSYQKELVENLNRNLKKVTYVLLGIAALLLLVTLVLINNTVRLSVYSRRFIIHTMKLVGASWGFIRRPFLRRAVGIGVVAALLAIAILGACIYGLYVLEPDILTIIGWEEMTITGVSVLLFGIIITAMCAYLAVNKFLKMTAGELYRI